MKTIRFLCAALVALGVTSTVSADHHKEPADVVGVWNLTASSDNGDRDLQMTIKKDGDKLSGKTVDGENGDVRNFDSVTIKEKMVTIKIPLEVDGNTGTIVIEGEEKAVGKLAGEWSIIGDDGTEYMSGEFTGYREVALAGKWDATTSMPNGNTLESVLSFEGKNSALKGMLSGNSGDIKIDRARVSDNKVRIEFEFEMNGNVIDVVIKAAPEGKDKLVGGWVASGDDGSQLAEGDWSAQRQAKSLAGKWDVVATVPDSPDYNGSIVLAEKGGKYSGKLSSSNGDSSSIDTVKVADGYVEFSLPFENSGYSGTLSVKAKISDDKLVGKWTFTEEGGSELASEAWTATRK